MKLQIYPYWNVNDDDVYYAVEEGIASNLSILECKYITLFCSKQMGRDFKSIHTGM